VKTRPTASKHHRKNLENFFHNYPGAIIRTEQHFKEADGAYYESDLFPIATKERTPLRLFLGQWQWLRSRFSLKNRADRLKTDSTRYTSEKGLDRFTTTVIIAVGLGLLYGPMWWLNFISNDSCRLAIITGFVTMFTVLIWAAAGNQRPFEVLAAAAAYAAVLMVFMQNSGGLD
jgi:hypothetical protein